MKKETYIKITQPFRDNPRMARAIHIANKLCTGVMYVAYPLLLLFFYTQNVSTFGIFGALFEAPFSRTFLVPAISFVLLSIGRSLINRQRPYEAFAIPSVIPKNTKGKSFPSRHVFSASIISMTFLLMSPWPIIGILFLCITIALAVIRVLSGVHYPSDVLTGILVGILAACLGYLYI